MKPKIEHAVARHIKPKTKNLKKKDIIGLQCYKQAKVNPHWGIKPKIERAVARHIKRLSTTKVKIAKSNYIN